MRIKLDYGHTGLDVELPDKNLVGPLRSLPGARQSTASDSRGLPARRHAAAGPAYEGRRYTCILICDFTRPVPNKLILPPMLRILEEQGIPRDEIMILVATGLHRPNQGTELEELVGPEIVKHYRIENHFGKKLSDHEFLGVTPEAASRPTSINGIHQAELKITTGLIEPHLMAGYSGGRKVICPRHRCGWRPSRVWHGPKFLEHPKADCGFLDGNPVHKGRTRASLKMAGYDFIVNVTIDGQRLHHTGRRRPRP